jgi:hypothetical protein
MVEQNVLAAQHFEHRIRIMADVHLPQHKF